MTVTSVSQRSPADIPDRPAAPGEEAPTRPTEPSGPPLPAGLRPRLANGFLAVAGTLVIIIGIVVLVGWFAQVRELISIRRRDVPMQPNTAAALVALGAAVISLHRHRTLTAILGGLASLVGCFTLIQYAAGIDVGIDQLLVHQPFVTTLTSTPGRPSPGTAFGIAAVGLTLGYAALAHRHRRREITLATVGALVGTLGLVAIYGYASRLESVYRWPNITATALNSAVAFVLLGGALLTEAWTSRRDTTRAASWLPLPAALVGLSLTFYIWIAIEHSTRVTQGEPTIVALFVGFAVSGLLALNAHLFVRADARRRAAELAEASLREEVERRSAVERELRETHAALARESAVLARSNRELTEFAYVASHDLSEPLRAISGYTTLLRNRLPSDPDIDEFAGYIVSGCQRLRHLIDDLLAYSRLGREEAAVAPVDCSLLLDQVRSSLGAQLADTGGVLEVEPLPKVAASASALSQLFQNLVGNALKFHRPDRTPHVRVSAEADPAGWLFRVADNGIGVAPRHRERIFSVFQRLHGQEEYEGTGIGLAICKKVVEQYGGRIWVEDTPGGGTTVCCTLPRLPE